MRSYEDAIVEQWQIARYNAYMLYCVNTKVEDRISIYDFHPLPGDPTPKEIAEMEKMRAAEDKERRLQKAKQQYERQQAFVKRIEEQNKTGSSLRSE
jgi:hypothetical protein